MTTHSGAGPRGASRTEASSSALLRRLNARKVLDTLWAGEPATASDLMSATGLTRATVLGVCRDLVETGWLEEAANTRNTRAYTKGRPALRYAFRAEKDLVLGIDAGQHRLAARVADLRGRELGVASRSREEEWAGATQRRGEIRAMADEALAAAGVTAGRIRCAVIGIPAPVTPEGASPKGDHEYWELMNPGLVGLFEDRGWACRVENDANLAALAELWLDPELAGRNYATLLAGERLGAGIVLEGRLLRQRRGGAGELGVLEMVRGVDGTEGVGPTIRRLAREAVAGESRIPWAGGESDALETRTVFRAAQAGDAVAGEVVDEALDRLARVCALLAGPLDLDAVVVSGGIAPAIGPLASRLQELVQDHVYAPWLEVRASDAGADAVRQGAVCRAIEAVREAAL